MTTTALESGVRRIECNVPVGEIQPGEALCVGLRVLLPPKDAPPPRAMLYCLPGGHMNLTYFDLGDQADRRFSMAEALAKRGFILVLADHPGTGGSDAPRDLWAVTLDFLAETHSLAATAALKGLRDGALAPGLDPLPDLVALGCGHSMGAVVTIEMQGRCAVFSGLVLLGYGSGGLPDFLPREVSESASDPDWLRAYLPELARDRFGTARIDPSAAREMRRGRSQGSPSFHTDNADPDGKLALRAASAPLLTQPGLFSMFPGVSDRPSAKIDVPILVVTGTHDFVDAGEALHAQFSACPSLEIFRPEDTGHNLFIFPSRTASYERIADWTDRLTA